MSWQFTTTNLGLAALAKMGGRITKVAAYSGTGTAEDLMEQTALVDVRQELVVIDDGVLGNRRWFRLQLSAPEEGYTLNQLGLFVSIDNGPLFLYMIAQNNTGNVIPGAKAAPGFIAEYTLPVVFSAGTEYDAPPSGVGFITPDALDARLLAFKVELQANTREVISDVPPDNPVDGLLWLKPIGELSLAGEIGGTGGVQPLNLVGIYMGDTPPEDTSKIWAKPI